MAKHVVMNKQNVPIKAGALEYVKPPTLNFKIEVDLPKEVEKEALKNPLLQQEWQTHADKVLDQTVATIEGKCKVFDKLFKGMIDKGADPKLIEKQLVGLNKAIQDDIKVAIKAAEIGVKDAWDDLVAKRKEWKGFKIKVGVSILGTLATLAISIAAMATAGFSGGAGGAIAIIGFIKSGVKIAQDIKRIAIDIEGAKKELNVHLKVVEAAAKNKGLFAANEVTGAILNEFIGIAQPTIKSCAASFDTFKAKYAQIVVNVHELSKTLNKILEKQITLEKDFISEAEKKLAKHPTKDKAAQFQKIKNQFNKAISKSTEAVQAAIIKIGEMYSDVKKWAPLIKEAGDRMKALMLKDMKGLKVFREALKFAALGLAPIDGNGIADKAQDLALGIGGAVGGYVYDKLTSKATEGTVFDAA
ncbi:MAG: hypothetical protein ABI832_22175 [bacterium]